MASTGELASLITRLEACVQKLESGSGGGSGDSEGGMLFSVSVINSHNMTCDADSFCPNINCCLYHWK